MPYDPVAAAHYVDANAQPHSTGNCARYVRRAIEHGGIAVSSTQSAKDYGSRLTSAGFVDVTGTGYPQRGDVVVIQSIPGHPHGHMAMFDGLQWVSDFKQSGGLDGFYPGTAYKAIKPPYKVYRHN